MNYIYKNNIYVVKSVFLLFLMIITSFCFDIPTSTARYEETETDYLKYHSSLTLVQKEEGNINLVSTSPSELTFSFSLFKDTINVKDGESTHYKLLLPVGCRSDYPDSIISSMDQNEMETTFTCDIDSIDFIDSNQNASFSVSVLESVNDEDYFLYQKYSFSDSISTFSNEIEEVNEEQVDSNSSFFHSFQDSLIQNILLYNPEYYSYKEAIESYIKSFDHYQDILGLQIDYRDYYDYNYTVLDSFIGYARTYYENREETQKNVMYFTDSSDSIDETFSYYLKTYYCADDMNQFYLISNYISSLGGVSAVVQNNATIEGITFDSSESKMVLDDKIFANSSKLVQDFKISLYVKDSDMRKETFVASILTNSHLSPNIRDKVIHHEEVLRVLDGSSETSFTTFVIGDKTDSCALDIVVKDGVYEIFLMPISVVEQGESLQIEVIHEGRDIHDIDPISIMNLVTQQFSLERSDDTYQTEQGKFLFVGYLKKEEDQEEVVVSPEEVVPPSESFPEVVEEVPDDLESPDENQASP